VLDSGGTADVRSQIAGISKVGPENIHNDTLLKKHFVLITVPNVEVLVGGGVSRLYLCTCTEFTLVSYMTENEIIKGIFI
jgi:hypothetical protein